MMWIEIIKGLLTAFFLFEGDALVCERVYVDPGTILRQLTEPAAGP